MMSTRLTSEDTVFIAQKNEYRNEKDEFREKMLKAIEGLGITYGFRRVSNAFDMNY